VKGGKRFGFAALVVVATAGPGWFRSWQGREVPEAISRRRPRREGDDPPFRCAMAPAPLHHDGLGHFGAGRVAVRSAPAGTGIIAAARCRAIFESLGVADVVTKSVGTSNPYNMIRATFEKRSKEQTSPRSVAHARQEGLRPAWARRRERCRSRGYAEAS